MILQADNTLIASGGVVVWYQDARLVASRIVVNGDSGDLTIEGPIHLSRPGVTDPGRDAIVIADSAQLDRDVAIVAGGDDGVSAQDGGGVPGGARRPSS